MTRLRFKSLEAFVNTAGGYGLSYAVYYLLVRPFIIPLDMTLAWETFIVTNIYAILSFGRSLGCRCLFEWIDRRRS